MKRIKIIFFVACLMAYATAVNAQSGFTVEGSQQYASFKFNDSQNTKLNTEYSGLLTGAYGIGYRFVSEGGLMVRGGLGMRNAGATLVYDDMNYSWKLQYADAKLGLGYMLIIDKINPYINVSGYYAYLVRGIQTINNEDFNITKSELLNKTDYGVIFSGGVQISLSYFISTFFEFNYLWGLANIEPDENQKASNYAYSLSAGLLFTIE